MLHLLVSVTSSQPISLSFLVLTPLAVALFLPWSLRTHLIWLLTPAIADRSRRYGQTHAATLVDSSSTGV